MNLKQTAQAFEPTRLKNISDLDKVSIDIDVRTEVRDGKDGSYTVYLAKIDGTDYRVPTSVLGGLKALLRKMPQLKFFSVLRSGEGMETTYQVIPFIEEVGQ